MSVIVYILQQCLIHQLLVYLVHQLQFYHHHLLIYLVHQQIMLDEVLLINVMSIITIRSYYYLIISYLYKYLLFHSFHSVFPTHRRIISKAVEIQYK